MDLAFVAEKNGKQQILSFWLDVEKKDIPGICSNFMSGFLTAMDNYSFDKKTLNRPCSMSVDGYKAWDDNGLLFKFIIK